VPPTSQGVCDVCHGAPGAGYRRCYSCAQTCAQVSEPVTRVVPISLYQSLGQLHLVLRGYEDSRDATARDNFALIVAALLTRYLRRHGSCVAEAAGADWDSITSVPSSKDRPVPHPLERAIQCSLFLREQFDQPLVRGTGPLGHRRASDGAFKASRDLSGRRILLLDDTFTTGAALESAASSLTNAWATVVAAVVVGRVINPEFGPEAAALWERATRVPFDFERCCLCSSD